MKLAKSHSPFVTEKTKNYSNWSEVFKDGGALISKMGNLINISKKESECEQWIFNTSQFLKSQKVKEDYGFSEPLIFILARNSNQNTFANKKSFNAVELKKVLSEKIDTLRIIKDQISSPVSKTKIFDYKEGSYFLNGNPINPNIHTLYYVLFDATYQITPDGGNILYSELKKYLTNNGATYKTKKSPRPETFKYESLESIKKLVKNNLLGKKGILKLEKVRKHLTEKQKKNEPQIFSASGDIKKYIFNNTQFK